MRSGALAVSFQLDADFERVRMPKRRPPRFADGLWRHTCFEVFVARKGSRSYREYNFSPSGEWAAYEFSSYRRRGAARIAGGPLKVGLCAVIEEKNGVRSYWALRHPPGKPDFHDRRTFSLELA